MKISIQTHTNENGYSLPVIHEVCDYTEAQIIAYAISRQLGRVTVRMTHLSDSIHLDVNENLKSYVEKLNGNYFQSK